MKKKLELFIIMLCAMMTMSACKPVKDETQKESIMDESSSINETSENEPYESVEGQQIKMTAGEVEVVITLNGSRAASDLVKMLPLELRLIERNGFAKGMPLPENLSSKEETTRKYSIGDLGYWNAGPELAIFYDDIYKQTIVSVIPLGKAEEGAEKLADASGMVTLELLEK